MTTAGTDVQQTPFVVLRHYRDLPEAVVAKSILDSAGIESFLIDENMVRIDWFWSNLLGRVKLWVRRHDGEDSNNLINQGTLEAFYAEGVGEFKQPRCPNCKSFDISFEELNKPVAFITAFLALPVPLKRRGWRCHTCRQSWPRFDNPSEPLVPSPRP